MTRQATTALKVLKTLDKYLERQAQKSLLMTVLCIGTVSVMLLLSVPKLPTRINLGDYEIAFALAMVFPIAGIWHYWRRYRTNKMGSTGENMVAQVLESNLGDDYYLMNNVLYANDRGNKEDIDHVVLGPNGIFSVETKHYQGKVTCRRGYWRVSFPLRRTPSSQAKSNAYWVNKAIKASGAFEAWKVWVEPIAVFSNPDVELDVTDPEVTVVTLDKLVNFVTSYDEGYSYSSEQLERMGEGILKQASNSIKQ